MTRRQALKEVVGIALAIIQIKMGELVRSLKPNHHVIDFNAGAVLCRCGHVSYGDTLAHAIERHARHAKGKA